MQSVIKKFNNSKYMQYLLFFIFSFIAFYLIKRHIFFRDDARPLLMAITANSFLDLFNEVRYESNPMLFHLILWLVNKITPVNVFVDKLLFLTINLATIFLIVFTLRIPNIYRLLILIQVPQIGLLFYIRQYSLTVLFLFIFTLLYIKKKDESTWIYFILFLLCQTCFHGMICTIGLYIYILSERYFYKNKLFKASDIIILLGVIFCLIQIARPEDIIDGLKEFKPILTRVDFFYTLHYIYDTLLSNPFSGIFFMFLIYKTFYELKSQGKFLEYGFLLSIGFIALAFYLICTLGYSCERHFWMFSYTTICLLLISNINSLSNYLQNKQFSIAMILVILTCIPFDIYTAKKDLSCLNGVVNIAKYLDKRFPEKLTLHEIDFLTDTINVYRKVPRKYYSLNVQRFNYYVKWNDPRVDFMNNKSKIFSIRSSKLLKDLEITPQSILDTEPIIVIATEQFLNDLKIPLNNLTINKKYKLIFKEKFPGSNAENFSVYQLIRI